MLAATAMRPSCRSLLMICLFLLLAGGCQERPKTAVSLSFQGQPLTECAAVDVDELKDGQAPGGIKLHCSSPNWSLWLIHDTRDLKDQRIKELSFSPPLEQAAAIAKALGTQPGESSLSFKAAVYSSALGKLDCPSAKALKRSGGEAPLERESDGSLRPGTYPIALASPCGQLMLTVGQP